MHVNGSIQKLDRAGNRIRLRSHLRRFGYPRSNRSIGNGIDLKLHTIVAQDADDCGPRRIRWRHQIAKNAVVFLQSILAIDVTAQINHVLEFAVGRRKDAPQIVKRPPHFFRKAVRDNAAGVWVDRRLPRNEHEITGDDGGAEGQMRYGAGLNMLNHRKVPESVMVDDSRTKLRGFDSYFITY